MTELTSLAKLQQEVPPQKFGDDLAWLFQQAIENETEGTKDLAHALLHVIAPLHERVQRLEADLVASKFAEREWHDKALDLLAEREEGMPNRPTD